MLEEVQMLIAFGNHIEPGAPSATPATVKWLPASRSTVIVSAFPSVSNPPLPHAKDSVMPRAVSNKFDYTTRLLIRLNTRDDPIRCRQANGIPLVCLAGCTTTLASHNGPTHRNQRHPLKIQQRQKTSSGSLLRIRFAGRKFVLPAARQNPAMWTSFPWLLFGLLPLLLGA